MLSIDIILCCYNQEEYVGQAVGSILCQKVDAKVRVIVADDGSTDNTVKSIQDHRGASPIPFLFLDTDRNVGMSANYKRAFARCRADYVAILEGDDWWLTDSHLSQHIDFLERHRRYSMSFNQYDLYYQEQAITRHNNWSYKDVDYLTINLRQQISWGNQIGNLSSCVFRTTLLQSLPPDFFQMEYADWELGIMMALHGPIGKLRTVTSVYRINGKGQWSALSSEMKEKSIKDSLENIRQFLPKRCYKYIKSYNIRIEKGREMPYPMPLTCRIKSTIKSAINNIKKRIELGLTHNNYIKNKCD